ncbi:MAG: hypothetical protein KUL82_06595, partial [Bdellovibrio sp.]|nr:hypothetical protein [Bdellovibrio sp.]
MKLHQSLKSKVCIVLLAALTCSVSQAQTEEVPELVEVQHYQDNLAPYKERREDHGAYIGLDYEGLDLKNFISTLDGKSYDELFGTSPIPLVHLSVDYKYNFILG